MTRSSLSKIASTFVVAFVLLGTVGTASGRSPPTVCEEQHNTCFKDCSKNRGNCLASCGQVSPTSPTDAQEKCVAYCHTSFGGCEKKCIAKKKECDRH